MRALRFLAGAALGFLVWWYGTLFYDGALSFAAERLLQLDHRLCGPHLVAADRKVEVAPRLCMARTATIPADQLTYNVILFAALFAMRSRRAASLIASLAVLIVTHALSLALSVESTYAAMGKNYSPLESDIWIGAEFWWRLVGMFALVFALWWLTTDAAPQKTQRKRASRRAKRALPAKV